jgi:hypothetical protein
MRIANNTAELIGNTPLVELNCFTLNLEYFNLDAIVVAWSM